MISYTYSTSWDVSWGRLPPLKTLSTLLWSYSASMVLIVYLSEAISPLPSSYDFSRSENNLKDVFLGFLILSPRYFKDHTYRWTAITANIYILCLSVCLFVRLEPMNVKTAEPIGPKFCVGPHVASGNVYEWSRFQKFVSNKIRFLSNFEIHEIFLWNPRSFLFCFTMSTKCSQLKYKMGAKPSQYIYIYCLSVCFFICLSSICLFVSIKFQNGWTDRAQTF